MHYIYNRMEVSRLTQVNIIMAMIMYMLTSVAIIVAMSLKLSTAHDDINPVNRILNGTVALVRDYPFMVSIQKNGKHNCGGTILNENWILTAAHCITNVAVSKLTVLAGTRKLDRGGIKKNVARVIPHPDYINNFGIIINDIGVLKLASSLSFDQPNIGIVTTSQQGDAIPNPGTTATAIGYGSHYIDGPKGKPLMKIEKEIIPISDCIILSFGANNPIRDFCTLDPQGVRNECLGDSGGPLLVNGIQIGIISRGGRGSPCHGTTPTIYTSISRFRNWITNRIAH